MRCARSCSALAPPTDTDAVNAIARKHKLKVISDTAQAPGALYNGKYAGTLTDIGGYSLNYHKHIHCGEGGVIVTNLGDAAEAREAVYTIDSGVIVLSGDVLLTQGPSAMAGQKLTINLKDGTGIMEGRVTTTFQPGGN